MADSIAALDRELRDAGPRPVYIVQGEERLLVDEAVRMIVTAAVGDPDLVAWDKHRDNPVLTARVHGGLRISQWRDPFVFREGGDWYMLIGGRVHRPERERGCIAIYRAADGGLMDWRFAGILYEWPDAEVTSIECPNLFRLGDRWLLLFSYHPPGTQVAWLSGWFDPVACTFSGQREGLIDLSPMGPTPTRACGMRGDG